MNNSNDTMPVQRPDISHRVSDRFGEASSDSALAAAFKLAPLWKWRFRLSANSPIRLAAQFAALNSVGKITFSSVTQPGHNPAPNKEDGGEKRGIWFLLLRLPSIARPQGKNGEMRNSPLPSVEGNLIRRRRCEKALIDFRERGLQKIEDSPLRFLRFWSQLAKRSPSSQHPPAGRRNAQRAKPESGSAEHSLLGPTGWLTSRAMLRMWLATAIMIVAFALQGFGAQHEIYPTYGHTGPLSEAVVSPDGAVVATRCRGSIVNSDTFTPSDDVVLLWDFQTQRLLRRLVSESGEPSSINFSADGKLIAAATDIHGSIQVWRVADGKQIALLEGRKALFLDDHRLVILKDSSRIVEWDIFRRATIRSTEAWLGDGDMNRLFRLSPDRRFLAVSLGINVRVFEMNSWRKVFEFSVWRKPNDLAFHPTKPLIAIGGDDCNVELWNLETGERVEKKLPKTLEPIQSLQFGPDGKILAIASGHWPGVGIESLIRIIDSGYALYSPNHNR